MLQLTAPLSISYIQGGNFYPSSPIPSPPQLNLVDMSYLLNAFLPT